MGQDSAAESLTFTYQILLVPTKATLFGRTGETRIWKGEHQQLSYEVKAPKFLEDMHQEVRLADKEDLSNLRGVVEVHVAPMPEDKKLGIGHAHIGWLAYNEESDFEDGTFPASYFASLWISRAQFDELLIAARLGKMPSSFGLDVAGEGIKFGWEPDGSGKEWDNKNHRYLAVVGLGFDVPLAHDPSQMKPEDIEDDRTKLEELPATRGQLAALTAKVTAFSVPIWIAAVALLYMAWRFAR